MHGVVVARPAEIGQPAGQSERPGIIAGEAQRASRQARHAGEAAIEVKTVHLVESNPGLLQRVPHAGPEGGRIGELGALAQKPLIVRILPAMKVNPAMFRDAQGSGCGGRRHEQGRRLINVDRRREIFRIGIGDHPVFRRRGDDFVSRAADREPGIGMGRRDGAVGSAKLAERLAMLSQTELFTGAQGRFDDGVSDHGQRRAVGDFHRMTAKPAVADRRQVQFLGAGEPGNIAGGQAPSAQQFAARQQGDPALPGGEPVGDAVDQPLRGVTTDGAVFQDGWHYAQRRRQRRRRVAVRVAKRMNDVDSVELLEQPRLPGVGGRAISGDFDQIDHRGWRRTVVIGVAGNLTDADQDGFGFGHGVVTAQVGSFGCCLLSTSGAVPAGVRPTG